MRTWTTAAALSMALVLSGAATAGAQTDFNWRGQIASGQTLEIKGVNGDIHAVASPSGDAEVTATKTARRSDPSTVRVEVVPHAGGVTICAVYPDVPGQEPNRCEPGEHGRSNVRDNDTAVHFEVRVPAGVKFVARTVNGRINTTLLNGDAEAHSVNGSVSVSATGLVLARTVNGSVHATMGRADWPDGATFSTVNGAITLQLPPVVNATINASTVNGAITSDYPVTVVGEFSRRHLRGTLGSGGRELRLSTVNGSIRLTQAP